MTKQEFEERIGATKRKPICGNRRGLHLSPDIKNVEGKDQVATLYKFFGMRLIYDMLPTAKEAKRLDIELRRARGVVKQLESEYEELKNGY